MQFRALLGLFMAFMINISYGQISFTNSTNLLENQTLAGGFVMGISDLNGDKLEDIIRFNSASLAEIEFQNPDGTFSAFNMGALISGDVWSVCVADIDKNGFNDLITGGFYESLFEVKTMGDKVFETSLLDGPLIFLQGSSFSDIDNDGNIDLFACHDDAISSPYRGSENGTLSYDLEFLNTASTVPSNNGGNYACTWSDYDNDGDNDLYISKCRLGVADPLHGERLNLMFRKEADGSFTEVAPLIGLQPQGQSWSTEFGDIDNDGDMDVIMINHDIPSMLFENDGSGNFTDISASAGINLDISNFPVGMQTFMQDYDNDGFLDILVTSYASYPKLFHNNGNKTFTEVTSPWGDDVNTGTNNNVQSAAMGDLNNDGFVDMIAGFANGINIPNGAFPDRLYLNDGNNNNWACVELVGSESNINGIGARIEIHGSWGIQIREVRSGHGYGVMNSMKANFGLGNATEITSIVVKWPSGVETTLPGTQININDCIVIEESTIATGYVTEEICEGESHFAGGAEQTTSGTYTDEINADSILVTELIVHPAYNIMANPVDACYGVTITYGDEEISAPGDYVFMYTTAENCDSIVNVTVNWWDEIVITEMITEDNGTGTGSISIDISGAALPLNSISWSNEQTGVTTITDLEAGDYTVDVIDANLCVMSASYTVGISSLENLIAEGINVYPNPFKDQIQITDKDSKIKSAILYNNLGQKIINHNVQKNGHIIDTKSLIPGIYILKILDHDNHMIGTMQMIK